MSDYKEREKEKEEQDTIEESPDSNPDPITGEPGSHPVGVGTGGVAGGATGAAIGGVLGGPIGAVVGGAIGAVAGGLAGKEVAEAIDPTIENEYWLENYRDRPYYKVGKPYDDYQKAYRYGWENAARPEYRDRSFEDIEKELKTNWPSYDGGSTSDWEENREPVRDAYDRIRGRK
jgi:hypothetical protein